MSQTQYDATQNLGPLGKFLSGYKSIFADETPNPNPNIVTLSSTRRHTGPAIGVDSGRSVMEHRPLQKQRLPIHWQPGTLGLEQEKPQEKPYEDPGPSAMFSQQTPAPAALPTLPAYEPIYDQAARENYDTSMGEIRGALDPVMGKRNALINELENYQGGALGSALSLNMLFNNLLPSQENIADKQAELKGKLVRRPLEGVHYGMEARTAGRKKLFEEELPSTQANVKYHQALAEKAGKEAALVGTREEHKQDQIDAKAAQHAMDMVKDITDPHERNKAYSEMFNAYRNVLQGNEYVETQKATEGKKGGWGTKDTPATPGQGTWTKRGALPNAPTTPQQTIQVGKHNVTVR